MRPKEVARKQALENGLLQHDRNVRRLPGIQLPARRECLAWQMVDSLRRIEFVRHISRTQLSPGRINPASPLFDPLRAAVVHHRQGNIDEAIWLAFLGTHFGKHHQDGWALARGVYGQLGGQANWDWSTISRAPQSFRPWLAANSTTLSQWRFSNHRKYESLNATSPNGTAAVIESYVAWVNQHQSHSGLLQAAQHAVGQNPEDVFEHLYSQMSSVRRFGRLGKFDFLTMLDKLGLAPISANSAYLKDNATGPRRGADLLFTGNASSKSPPSRLETYISELDQSLNVGKQVLEDALCNWQKSPNVYVYFRG